MGFATYLHSWQVVFKRWLRDPLGIGLVTPSSKSLSRLMAAQIPEPHNAYVLELGPGTGPITQAMLDLGVRPDRLILIERDAQMTEFVQKKFPQLRVINADAADMIDAIPREMLGNVRAVVSSLPLLAMPNELRRAIIQQAFALMEPDGHYVQFSYGLIPPFSPTHLNLRVYKAGRVWDNFPPAAVWVYEKT